MKYIFLFVLIGLFSWVALVPPEGMSKYPSVDVEFQYAQDGTVTRVQVDAGLQPPAAEEASAQN